MEKVNINKLLTNVNYTKGNGKQNKYIVIHYVGATGGAEANCKYFQNVYRGASANYFVGHSGEIWQSVEDFNTAWHCGAKKYKHSFCRNSNSIGIEMCCKQNNSGWYFEEATVNSTIELTKELMKKYNIPVENVLRHYDITGKVCPEPYVRDAKAWQSFKNRLTANTTASGSFKVKVTAESLNIRAGAGTKYKINGKITDKGVYTIVETDGIWGKLKSGAGWISLNYTKRL